jgi:hypothetical protein
MNALGCDVVNPKKLNNNQYYADNHWESIPKDSVTG